MSRNGKVVIFSVCRLLLCCGLGVEDQGRQDGEDDCGGCAIVARGLAAVGAAMARASESLPASVGEGMGRQTGVSGRMRMV